MDLSDVTVDQTLDAKGLSCPLPLLKTKSVLEKLSSGQVLEILGTDQNSKHDLPGWCNRSGHKFLGYLDENDHIRFFIKKG